MMDAATAHRVGDWICRYRPPIVDITGGAPELSEFFCYLVEIARQAGADVIDRSNLTIIEEKDYAWLPDGKLLMAKDSKLFAVVPLTGANWAEVADFSHAGIQRITRIAVNSKGSRIAIVGVSNRK